VAGEKTALSVVRNEPDPGLFRILAAFKETTPSALTW